MAMVSSSISLLFSLLLLHPLLSVAKLPKSHLLTQPTSSLSSLNTLNDTPPTVFFEVTKPIKVPNTKPCIHHVLHHDFGYTYGQPPVLAIYSPPSHCPSNDFSTVVMEWKATCKGRQFDRIFGVWLGGVELLRSCTAEPRATGIVWTVQKDVTRYYSLLLKNETQELAVFLGNIVNNVYTGVYHVDVTLYFYPAEEKSGRYNKGSLNNLVHGDGSKADLILPISRNLPLNDALWFEIQNSTDVQSKKFKIPQNVYRAVLEVYVSFHENDESWYSNYPNEYIVANNLTGFTGNGTFREVLISLDGVVVGAVWPFTVIYTGGVNPLLWRPITAISSFNLPTYDIEITPFLGNLLDGKSHEFGFSVTNALNVWYIDANLHLWLDRRSAKTEGKVLEHSGKPLSLSLISNFNGLNGTFLTSAWRSITSNGWVNSSYGKIITHFNQQFSYSNFMEMDDNGNVQIVSQTIYFNDSSSFRKQSSIVNSFKSLKKFVIDMSTGESDEGNGTSFVVANATLRFDVKTSKHTGFSSASSSLENLQNAQGVMVVKDNLVQSGVGSTQQVYKYHDGLFCHFRNVSASNYTILYDKVRSTCNERKHSHSVGFGLGKWLPFSSQRASAVSKLLNNGGI